MPSFREVFDLIKKTATFEAQQQLIDLQEEHLATREENVRLREEIANLKAKIEDVGATIWEEPYYFRLKNGLKDGPFCQVCKDSEGKMVRLQKNTANEPAFAYRCGVCPTVYEYTRTGPETAITGISW
jgi:hypothetical protein